MNPLAPSQVLKSKIETLLGMRGPTDQHAARMQDLQSLNQELTDRISKLEQRVADIEATP